MIVFLKMDKIENRAVIHCFKVNTPMQIKYEYVSTYQSFTIAKFWTAEYKRCHKSLEDDKRSRRPKTLPTDKNIAKAHQMVLGDRLILVGDIADVTIKVFVTYYVRSKRVRFSQLCWLS